jgi:predicted ArsR family transcriptional regulator
MESVTMAEAAKRLGVSVDTIRRKLRRGELQGYQQPRPQGFIWAVELPEESDNHGITFAETVADTSASYPGSKGEIYRLEEMVAVLQAQVVAQQKQMEAQQEELTAKNKQIEQLHVLLQQAQAALPAPRDNRSWWQRLWRRE